MIRAPFSTIGVKKGLAIVEARAGSLGDIVDRLGTPKVLVVGDLILDRYVWGNAERISQEAPVILLRADRREERLGGAASVAMMLSALGAEVTLAGVWETTPPPPAAENSLMSITFSIQLSSPIPAGRAP